MREIVAKTRGGYFVNVDRETGELIDEPKFVQCDTNFLKCNFSKIANIAAKLTCAQNTVFWGLISHSTRNNGKINIARNRMQDMTGYCKNIVDTTIPILIREDFIRRTNCDDYYINPNVICFGNFDNRKIKAYEGLPAPENPFNLRLTNCFYKIWIENACTMLCDASKSDNRLLAFLFSNKKMDKNNTFWFSSISEISKISKLSEKTVRKSLKSLEDKGFLVKIGNRIMINPDCVSNIESKWRPSVVDEFNIVIKTD